MQRYERSSQSPRPDLLRAARAVLGWSLVETGRRAAISISIITSAEGRGVRSASVSSSDLDNLRRAYEDAGISFHEDGTAGRGISIEVC